VRLLIIESRSELGLLWQRHLQRMGIDADRAGTQEEAIAYLTNTPVDMIILDLVLEDGPALAVSNFANYRQPDAQIIFVTSTSFFSDGSIFAHSENARAFLSADIPPDDLVAMVEHYGKVRHA
jgi:DNA-binding NtrC family response regulator